MTGRLSRFLDPCLLAACLVLNGTVAGHAQSTPSAPAVLPAEAPAVEVRIREQLAQAKRQRDTRSPQIEAELRTLADSLKSVETALQDRVTVDLIMQREELSRRREVLRAELKELQDVATAWQSASDSYQDMQRAQAELATLQEDLKRKTARFRTGDAVILKAQLQRTRSVLKSQSDYETVYRRDLADVEAKLREPKVDRRSILESQRRTLLAQLESLPIRRSANEARRLLQETQLAEAERAQERGETKPASQPATTQAATSTAVAEKEAANKQRLAQALESESRGGIEYARQQIAQLQKEREELARKGKNTDTVDYDLQYWTESERYGVTGLRQATMKKREGEQKQEILSIEQKLQDVQKQLDDFRNNRVHVSADQRTQLAEQFRLDAKGALAEAGDLDDQAATALLWIKPNQEALPMIDAAEAALWQRLSETVSLFEYQRLDDHYRRMKRLFDAERQQVDQMITSQTVGYYQLQRQAQLKRQLADLYVQTGDVLVPTEPSFWERHKRIFRAIFIFACMVAAGYVLKACVWLTEVIATWLRKSFPAYNFSVKRVATLASFARSITQLFIWIFGIITILFEFGIDPATSSGAIGLVGLIMAGMFQQIVVDFIKGLDIIAGRHYNVGDFVELDGKFGHVIDFNAKYTRIRTVSGQEVNIPNSRCIPSRRFPDGYVDNYIDIVLTSGADVNEAKAAIQPVCMYLNRRLEPLKERPQFIDRFRSVAGRAILRYRVRVLPGCDWVIKDYFIPAVQTALAARDIAMDGEPRFFFINRIDTFRKLFSRQLTEQEILQEASEVESPTADRPLPPLADKATSSDKPSLPPEPAAKSDKPSVPADSDKKPQDKPAAPHDGESRSRSPAATPEPRAARELNVSHSSE